MTTTRPMQIAIVGGDARALRAEWPRAYRVSHFSHLNQSKGRQLADFDRVVVLVKFIDNISLQHARKYVPHERLVLFSQSVYELAKRMPAICPPPEVESPYAPISAWRLCPTGHLWCTAENPGDTPRDPSSLEVQACRQHPVAGPATPEAPDDTAPAAAAARAAPGRETAPTKKPWSKDDKEALRLSVEAHGDDASKVLATFNDLTAPRSPGALYHACRSMKVGTKALVAGLWHLWKHGREMSPPLEMGGATPVQQVQVQAAAKNGASHKAPPAVTAPYGTATEQKQRIKAVRFALQQLAAAAPLYIGGREVFAPGAGAWKTTLVRNLHQAGLLESERPATPAVRYRTTQPEVLLQYGEDPSPLWSTKFGQVAPPTPPVLSATAAASPPPAASPEGNGAPSTPASLLTPAVPSQELLEAAVKLLAACVESLQRIESKLNTQGDGE